MRNILLGTALAISVALARSPASAKTAKECSAEYAANKAAIKATQKKADFIAACRAGTEALPGAAAAPAPAPAPAPDRAAPASTGFFGRKKAAPAPSAPAAPSAAAGANQFGSAAQAQARCPGATVVWVNTKSGVYHFAGTKNFGNTKAGAYMCEADATAAGDRASKTEKHP